MVTPVPPPAPAPTPAPAAPDPELQRARSRRTLLALLGVVAVLALFTFGYVWLYGRVLREPDQPPSVLAKNPRVLAFEVALAACALLVLGFGILRLVKRRP